MFPDWKYSKMETLPAPTTDHILDQFCELFQSLIRMSPHLILPEDLDRFRQQLDVLKAGGQNGPSNNEDYLFLFRVLIILAHQEIPPTMGELSAELNVPDSTATRIVDWLVQSRFVVRLPDPSDRRVIRVSMTESGQGFYEISSHYIQQRIGVLLSDFSDVEKAEFYRLLTKLYVAFQREE